MMLDLTIDTEIDQETNPTFYRIEANVGALYALHWAIGKLLDSQEDVNEVKLPMLDSQIVLTLYRNDKTAKPKPLTPTTKCSDGLSSLACACSSGSR